jgi:hypothetical protein
LIGYAALPPGSLALKMRKFGPAPMVSPSMTNRLSDMTASVMRRDGRSGAIHPLREMNGDGVGVSDETFNRKRGHSVLELFNQCHFSSDPAISDHSSIPSLFHNIKPELFDRYCPSEFLSESVQTETIPHLSRWFVPLIG